MSAYDPRIIAIALEDLLREMALWSAKASDTLAFATYSQRQAQESAERMMHQAAIFFDQAQLDEERVAKITSEASAIVDKCEGAAVESNQTLDQAQEAVEAAASTLELWEEELGQALVWLERAKARLARAEQEYNQACRAFDQAGSNLEHAEARLRACRNDRERHNCNREAEAVREAQIEFQQAAHRVQIAEIEVAAAREEVAAAKARVACCRRAVEYATQALSVARDAESQSLQAVNSAERSSELAKAAAKSALAARERIAAEIEIAEQMLSVARNAASLADEAAARLTTADKAEESAQRYLFGARREIEHRVHLLYEINRPDMGIAVSAAGGPVGTSAPSLRVSPAPGNRADKGIRFVNVADLPDPSDISGSEDFKKVPESEMRSGLMKLQEMRPLIENGTGASADYWADYDRKQGLDFANGYQRVYEAFYGDDFIRLNKHGDSYSIDNGRHRIWLAKRMGISQLPMQIVEKHSGK